MIVIDRIKRHILTAVALVALAATQALAGQEVRVDTRAVGIDGGGAYLGVEMEEVTASNMAVYKLTAERGVIVRNVEKGTPAEAAGLQVKDVILEFSGTPVLSTSQFSRMVRETPVGRKVDLVVSRDGKKVSLSAKLGERPGGGSFAVTRPGDREGRVLRFEGPQGRDFSFRVPDDLGGSGRNFVWRGIGPEMDLRERPRLGVTLDSLTDQMGEFLGVPGKKGALVVSVTEGTPAAGKLKAGDVIVRADDKAIENAGDLERILRGKGEEAKVDLKVIRDKKELSLAVELARSGQSSRGYRM